MKNLVTCIFILVITILSNVANANVHYWKLDNSDLFDRVELEWMSDAATEEECLDIVDHAEFDNETLHDSAVDQCMDQDYN
jgi:hypothetical protein